MITKNMEIIKAWRPKIYTINSICSLANKNNHLDIHEPTGEIQAVLDSRTHGPNLPTPPTYIQYIAINQKQKYDRY